MTSKTPVQLPEVLAVLDRARACLRHLRGINHAVPDDSFVLIQPAIDDINVAWEAYKTMIGGVPAADVEAKAERLRVRAAKERVRAEAAGQVADLLRSTPGVETVGGLMDKAQRVGDAETVALLRQAFGVTI